MTLPRPYWQDMTSPEVAALDAAALVAVLPLAAIEQHGPHLPLSTDADIAAGILDLALSRRPAGLPATALPPLLVGKSDEHLSFPGTLSLEAGTLVAAAVETASCLARRGVRRLVLLNGHGGNRDVLGLIAGELRRRHDMLVAKASVYDLLAEEAASLFGPFEVKHGIHAGAVETSLMLHLKPGAVRREALADFPSATAAMREEGYRLLSPQGPHGFYWRAEDLNPAGAVGDAGAATAEAGRKLAEAAAARLLVLLEEVARFCLARPGGE